jgi:hypothetical protein
LVSCPEVASGEGGKDKSIREEGAEEPLSIA